MDDFEGLERRKMPSRDRDILIEMSSNLRNLVSVYEKHVSMDDTKHLDFELRIRSLERSKWLLVGAIAIVQIAIKYFFK